MNYSLPKNTKLDLTGYIQDPLQVNIIASEWEDVDEDWDIAGVKVLNLSALETSITDFNGARISFTSNMPIVKVLPELYVGATGTATDETEKIFNDLVLKYNDTPLPAFCTPMTKRLKPVLDIWIYCLMNGM